MSHQVDRSRAELLDEGDHIVDMLRDRIGVAAAVPTLGEEMPQADRDHAMFAGQRAEHRRPDAKIAERAMHAHQRPAFTHLEIGHVIAVDAEGLHWARWGGGRFEEVPIIPWNPPLAHAPGSRSIQGFPEGGGDSKISSQDKPLMPRVPSEFGWIATISKPRLKAQQQAQISETKKLE